MAGIAIANYSQRSSFSDEGFSKTYINEVRLTYKVYRSVECVMRK